MLNGLQAQIDIKVRPAKVPHCWLLDLDDATDRSVFKPRKVVKGEKQLATIRQQPESVAGYVRNLNSRSGNAMP